MPTFLPQDSNDNPIPALRLKNNGAHKITSGSTSARNTTAFNADTRIISLYTTSPVYIAFGDSNVTVTSSGHYFPSGIYYDISIGGDKIAHNTHIAVLAVDNTGDMYVSEKE